MIDSKLLYTNFYLKNTFYEIMRFMTISGLN